MLVDPNIANFEINTVNVNLCGFLYNIDGNDYFSISSGAPGGENLNGDNDDGGK